MSSNTIGVRRAVLVISGMVAMSACGSGDVTDPGPPLGALSPGGSAPAANGVQLQIAGGASGGEFVLVVSDTATTAAGTSSYSLVTAGVTSAGTVSAPATTRLPAPGSELGLPDPSAPELDIAYGSRMSERYRARYRSLFEGARLAPSASRSSSASAPAQVGDILSLNVAEDPCNTPVLHPGRVVAVGSLAIVVEDTLNPRGGFTTADYQRIAANFDTLVYPVDVENFGAPSDIDANGHVLLFFTNAVNALTPRGSTSFVGGFFSPRDLFPRVGTPRLQACAGSNVAEMFYLLSPDPTGSVNGNVRTTGFVDSLTTGVVGHEFQHLINSARRIYVNNANDLEVVWLNEGLSHIAEELLFYREGGVGPRQNIDVNTIRAREPTRLAFNQAQAANASRYRSYLVAPSKNSPIRNDDSLATRGATWDFLRYAADRRAATGTSDAATWQALVNSPNVGLVNLRAVFGADLGGQLRDWSVSHYTDDVVAGVSSVYTQPSWNWHSIFQNIGDKVYPLQVNQLAAGTVSGTVIPGASAYYRFAVPANMTATVTISGGTAATGLPVGTVVRIR